MMRRHETHVRSWFSSVGNPDVAAKTPSLVGRHFVEQKDVRVGYDIEYCSILKDNVQDIVVGQGPRWL